MPTISDVAAVAGVSMKSVARVLNNEPHVRPVLRERVLRAVDKLGYKPHLAAKQLAGNRSYVLAFMMLEANISYYAGIVIAAAAECRKHGYHLASETIPVDEPPGDAIVRVTAQLKPDGIILPAPLCDDTALIDMIAATKTPLVRIASAASGYGQAVYVDELSVTQALVTHLVDLGHDRIGFIAPPMDHSAARQRRAGYETSLVRAGLDVDPTLVEEGEFTFTSGVLAARRLLSRGDRPTAIFAANDAMALGTLAVAGEMRLRVPEDLAVAGFDDSPSSRMCYPALTTVRQPLAGMARAAVLGLLGRDPPIDTLTHELVLRGSTTGHDRLVLGTIDA